MGRIGRRRRSKEFAKKTGERVGEAGENVRRIEEGRKINML